ncbi:hypothetical protein DSO57_1009002 [Entomophthora muscae]|uniref:Uncharacterized protein n=1 Tax=Entomophthora muscae TaxID=34485 RepID=A0ACC2UH25_9FUNG|nr:hypothetical protein DSO57_1009002 [Entomophthora muscae]
MHTSLQLSTIAKKRNHTGKNKILRMHPLLDLMTLELNEGKASSAPVEIQEDSHGSFVEMIAFLCWEEIPTLCFCRPVVMWSTLMLALETPYVISTKKLEVGNTVHWSIPRVKLVRYAQLCLQDFSFNGIFLTDNQISRTLKLLELVFTAWANPRSAIGPVPLWHGSDSHEYWLRRAMGTTLEFLSYGRAGSCQSMTLVGNLVLSGSKVVYHQRLHHMPEYIEWLLGVILLWECILLRLAFPYSIGINYVNFLPVDKSPFLPFAFRWLPNV